MFFIIKFFTGVTQLPKEIAYTVKSQVLKVSRSRNKIVEPYLLPKNKFVRSFFWDNFVSRSTDLYYLRLYGVCYLFRKLSNSSKELYGEKQFFRVHLVVILKVLGFSADDYHWLCSLVQSINHRTDLERKFALLRFHDFSSQHCCAKCNQKSWPIMELDSNIICIRLECFRLRS